MKKKLEDMVSSNAYNEIIKKAKIFFGEEGFEYFKDALIKSLEEGSGKLREQILGEWLDTNCTRVCSICEKIMEEGWYLNTDGYACSDECAAKEEGITMEDFKKWRIYKDDIQMYLEETISPKRLEDLTQEECDEIIDEYCQDCDYYYTEWY